MSILLGHRVYVVDGCPSPLEGIHLPQVWHSGREHGRTYRARVSAVCRGRL